MKLRRKIGVVFGAAALIVGSASAAQAGTNAAATATGLSFCPTGYACFWDERFYDGAMGKVQFNNPDFRRLSGGPTCSFQWDNCIRSIANRGTQCTVFFYSDYGYGKTHSWHSLSRGDEVADFALGYHDNLFEDAISSNRWCTS